MPFYILIPPPSCSECSPSRCPPRCAAGGYGHLGWRARGRARRESGANQRASPGAGRIPCRQGRWRLRRQAPRGEAQGRSIPWYQPSGDSRAAVVSCNSLTPLGHQGRARLFSQPCGLHHGGGAGAVVWCRAATGLPAWQGSSPRGQPACQQHDTGKQVMGARWRDCPGFWPNGVQSSRTSQ